MESLREVVEQINNTRTQVSASAKDEVTVMKAMLNDADFRVDVYGRNGVEGSYCPYEDSRTMIGNIIRDTTKITGKEAMELSNGYEFGKQESTIMVGLAKEFINTYLDTGRKLPLGGRADSNISISKKMKGEGEVPVKKVGVNGDGTDKFIEDGTVTPPHKSIRVYSSCPSWLKDK